MADLYIDRAVLARTRDRLRSIEDLLRRPCREMGALPSEAVAQEALHAKLREFGDEWSYGIGKLGDFSAAASEALGQVEQAFRDVDDELTSALDEAARGPAQTEPGPRHEVQVRRSIPISEESRHSRARQPT